MLQVDDGEISVSIQAVAWALEQSLPARPKLVLISIANHADHTNGYCWLKAETIAREAACTPRSIYRFIGGLVRNGYIRKAPKKGDDGKQRANDYWIMFGREEKPWDWGASLAGDEAEGEPEDGAPDEIDPQDVVEPHDRISRGESGENSPGEAVDKHVVSPGPCDNGVTRYESLEPSKSKPKERTAPENVTARPPRHYRPPPPQPVGEVFSNAKEFFAYEKTPAYDAWARVKAKENGLSSWHLTTRKLVDGKWRTGWYFPSLFPPTTQSTDPLSESDHLSEQDKKDFAESG